MILVDVYVPAMDDNYDFMLDENTAVRQIITEISGMISKRVMDASQDFHMDFQLYSMNTKKLLDAGRSLYMNQVTDGSRLLLI